ncbi:MAG: glycosyl transferase, partial [Aeromonas veronii]
YLLAWLGVIWFINLYNFMDGIDGLAAGEAVVVCLFMALFHYLVGGEWSSASLILLLGISAAGFLCWNFPPARIFMGDGGSGFLGLMLASLMLLDAASAPQFLWAWLVMLGVFVVDATWTLLNRFRLKCRLSQAHRTHAFQYAARRWQSHRNVTLAVLLINSLWLAPIAVMIVLGQLDGVSGLVIAYLPLAFLAYHLNAGVPE